MRHSHILAFLVGVSSATLTVLNSGGLSDGEEHIHYHHSLPGHKFRVQRTDERVCAGNEGIAGYLDIDEGDRHLSFWAFESRNEPETDPIILWMTGGPGCASIGVGMLVELGPCLVKDNETTVFNPFAWNSNATLIFVDQPVNVGYSNSPHHIKTAAEATKDMLSFLGFFFDLFPKLAGRDFYIAGESFGGTWVPVLAASILESQTSLMSQIASRTAGTQFNHINLRGIMLGNAQVAQRDQWKGFYDTGCTGIDLLFNASVCAVIQDSASRCEDLLLACAASDYNPIIVAPILQYCRERSVFFIQDIGKNPYDFRRDCEGDEECYLILNAASEYMNQVEVKRQLGVSDDMSYSQCNSQISHDFVASGDTGRETTKQVSYLLNEGIDILVYVGNKDWFCNAAGMRYFVNDLVWDGLAGFRAEAEKPWKVGDTIVGTYKQWTRLTFLELFDAGHMVPMDQPEAALQMLNRWINETRKAF